MRAPSAALVSILACLTLPASAHAELDWWLDSGAAGSAGSYLSWPEGTVDIDAPQAWRLSTGRGQTVAVIDSGVALNHPQLAGGLWVNQAETPGNRRDDDRNGYVDDIHGVDVYDHDGRPQDPIGHGSHIAGLINAPADGDKVTGVAPDAEVMAVRAVSSSGWTNARLISSAVRYAVRNRAGVINLSLGDLGRTVCRTLRWAGRHDTVIVVAAGNDRENLDRVRRWPASCRMPQLVTVAAHRFDGALAPFSARGRKTVTLAAPGTAIVSAGRHGAEPRTGTSMAAAVVSGVAALVRAARPGMTAAQVAAHLRAAAIKDRALPVRGGRVNALAALERLP